MFVRIVEAAHAVEFIHHLSVPGMVTTSCVALSVARIWSILIQVVLMIMLVMLVGVDGMVTMMTTMKIMTMMKKKINCCNYGAVCILWNSFDY